MGWGWWGCQMLKILQKLALATGFILSKGILIPKTVVRRVQVSGSHKLLFSFLSLFSGITVYMLPNAASFVPKGLEWTWGNIILYNLKYFNPRNVFTLKSWKQYLCFFISRSSNNKQRVFPAQGTGVPGLVYLCIPHRLSGVKICNCNNLVISQQILTKFSAMH